MKKFILIQIAIVFYFSLIPAGWTQTSTFPVNSENGTLITNDLFPDVPDEIVINPDEMPDLPDEIVINPETDIDLPEELINIQIAPGSRLKDLRLISFPLDMKNSNSIDVFPQINHENYEPDFRLGSYNPLISTYNEFGNNLNISPGRSFWILARKGIEISVKGIQVSTIDDFDLRLIYNPASKDGWNMAACPNDKIYDWNNGIQVFQKNDNGEIIKGPVSITSFENDLVDPVIWKWKNGTYAYFDPKGTYENQLYEPDTDIDANLLKPGQGYWIKVLKENVWLRFPGTALADQQYPAGAKFMHMINNTKNKVKKYLFYTKPAIADSNNGPPDPIGSISSADGGSAGCFIQSAVCK